MKFRKSFLTAAVACLAVTLFGQGANMPAPTVMAGKAVSVNEAGTRKYIGKIEAIEDVTLRARINGYLEKINFKEGEMVRQGDLLFQIEDTTYEASLKSTEARMAQMKAELEYAQKNFNRQKNLSENKIVSESTMEEATRLLNFDRARLAEIQATLVDARNNLSYTKVKSPINGRIGKVSYTRGNYLSVGNQLANIVQIAPIYVAFSMSEADYMSMFGNADNARAEAVVRIKTADKKIFKETGKVQLVDNKIDAQTGTIKIWAVFENKSMELIPGGLVDVMISRKTVKTMPAVKLSAVLLNRAGHYVYLLSKDNKAIMQPVTVGEVVGDFQIIRKGVKAGDTVLTDGTHKVMRPGMVVSPVFEKTSPAAK